MEKIVCLGGYYSGAGMLEFKELDKLLQDGWEIVKMKPIGTKEAMCCYVWLEKYDDDFDEEDDFGFGFEDDDWDDDWDDEDEDEDEFDFN